MKLRNPSTQQRYGLLKIAYIELSRFSKKDFFRSKLTGIKIMSTKKPMKR